MATEIEEKQASNTQNSRVNEIVAVILLALAVLFFLCLISYSPADWSLNGTGQGNQKTQNWIGVVGAVVSDLLFQFVGLIAYVFPALLALIAWRVFYAESLMPRVSRIIGFLLLLISAPALIDLINLGDGGGMIGAGFARFFIYLLSPIGAGILLFTLLTASILLLTNFHFSDFSAISTLHGLIFVFISTNGLRKNAKNVKQTEPPKASVWKLSRRCTATNPLILRRQFRSTRKSRINRTVSQKPTARRFPLRLNRRLHSRKLAKKT
jgi:DNA segregation ATPase FtsK/SpoIIIE-like protein